MNRPQFIIIGAPKCGTTWLWTMLKRHPEIHLGKEKEIYYFSNVENYRKGRDWYYAHFQGLDSNKMLGEGSTQYFYDRLMFNDGSIDETLPVIPELIKAELPNVKILLILRDPVERFISAYYHHLQYRFYPPSASLLQAAQQAPSRKMIERGFYARYLSLWRKYFSEEQMHCMIFEEDVLLYPEESIAKMYGFLGLNPNFKPKDIRKSQNKTWTWTHLVLNYYLGPGYFFFYRVFRKVGMESLLMRINFIKRPEQPYEDIEALRALYLPEKKELESLLGRDLSVWRYGVERKR